MALQAATASNDHHVGLLDIANEVICDIQNESEMITHMSMVCPDKSETRSSMCIVIIMFQENTLSSLALVFVLHYYYKFTPHHVMGEIDADLDFENVAIISLTGL